MKLRIFSFIIFLGMSFSTQKVDAQNTLSDFLLTAFEDDALTVYDDQTKFLTPRNYRIPVIDDLEIRVANDELVYDDLQYAVRVNPANPWQIRRNNALFNATKKELSLRRRLEFKEALLDRYELALDFLYASEQAKLTERQLYLAKQKTSLFEENFETNLFDARDFVEAKLDQVDGVQALDGALISAARLKRKIELKLQNNEIDWSNFELLSVSQIDSLSSIIVNTSFSSTELELIAQRVEVAKREVSLERADFGLGFIQAEYAPFRNNDNSEIGFSAGISIPIFKSNKPQIAERKLDEIELENELKVGEREDSVNKILEFEYLKNLIYHHQKIEDQVEMLNLEELIENLSRSEDYDPISIIKLEEGIFKIEELLLKSRQRVFEQYLDFLFTFDALTQKPLINYLSRELEEIK